MKRLVVGCFGLIGGIVVLMLGISFVGAFVAGLSGLAPPTPTPAPGQVAGVQVGAADGSTEHPYPPDAAVTVADIRWTILKAGRAPNRLNGESPRGVYVVVAVSVENQGKEARSVSQLDLLDDEGRRFQGDFKDFGLEPPLLILESLNPGLTLEFSTVFDVPEDAKGLMIRVSNLRVLGEDVAHISLGDLGEWKR